jgi:quercetin dioxygenase-like cupin family protein
MKKSLFASGMIVVAGTAMAQTAHPGAVGQHMMPNMVPADAQLKWTPSTVLPKGAEGAVLIGDPTKSGEVIIVRSKFPPNYQAPAHTHPFTETITVISGSVGFGEDKIDKAIPMAKAGAVFLNPAGHAHTIWTGDEPAIIQVQYIGPGALISSIPPTIRAKNKSPAGTPPQLEPRHTASVQACRCSKSTWTGETVGEPAPASVAFSSLDCYGGCETFSLLMRNGVQAAAMRIEAAIQLGGWRGASRWSPAFAPNLAQAMNTVSR